MTTQEINEEKKKLAAVLHESILASPLYQDELIDIEISCVKLAPVISGTSGDKIVGVHITTKVI